MQRQQQQLQVLNNNICWNFKNFLTYNCFFFLIFCIIAAAAEPEHIAKSPSDFSCHSYELFVGQEKGNDDNNKEKMSIRSEGLESVSEITRTTAPTAIASAKVRKVSTVSMGECFA